LAHTSSDPARRSRERPPEPTLQRTQRKPVIDHTEEMQSTHARNHRPHHVMLVRAALVLLGAGALALGNSATASAEISHAEFRAENICSTPHPGSAACLGIRLVSNSLTSADLRAAAGRQAGEEASGVTPAVTNKAPLANGLTPAKLHSAYRLPTEVLGSSTQTIAVVDAYNDPTAEADLGVYDSEYGLPACTTANGCFRKLNQEGKTSPLPASEGGWATEISLDVQMAHAICQGCHVLLVEANNTSFAALGAAVDAAVSAGATVVSNSYGGPEEAGSSSYNAPYNHPGVVITVSAGDCGYYDTGCEGYPAAANFPASSPDVVAVGGTSLYESEGAWNSTVWAGGGSGCSIAFTAPLWQSAVSQFSATKCGTGRSVADVAAVGNPYTGVEVYDSTPSPGGYPTGWGIWGGTSVASPIIAAEFALAGGAHSVQYPAQTLYSNIGNSGALFDVVSGSNGSCKGASSCEARSGYDGPTGVGSPVGLSAFDPASSPENTSLPTISGTAEEGQTLTVSHGAWSNSPSSYSDQWAKCNASGASCTAIAGATGLTYKLPATYVGDTLRVQESASSGSGSGAAVISAATAKVSSDVPKITSFTPTSGLTGATVTITGTALTSANTVRFDGSKATFTVDSPTQIDATVPNGALVGDISVTTPAATASSTGEFKPTFSVGGFSPLSGAPGAVVTISGLGFLKSSSVSFHGVPATSVTYVSATKLKATVPSGVGVGAITVTNAAAPVGSVSSAANFTTN
jgi:subtilisin family serine protease